MGCIFRWWLIYSHLQYLAFESFMVRTNTFVLSPAEPTERDLRSFSEKAGQGSKSADLFSMQRASTSKMRASSLPTMWFISTLRRWAFCWNTSRSAQTSWSSSVSDFTLCSRISLCNDTNHISWAPTGAESRCTRVLTCSRALSNCLTRSSRSCAGKCRAPTSSSPTLCLVMVMRRSCEGQRSGLSSHVTASLSEVLGCCTGTLLSPWTSSSRCFSSFTSSESWEFLSLQSLSSWAKLTSIKHQPSQRSLTERLVIADDDQTMQKKTTTTKKKQKQG